MGQFADLSSSNFYHFNVDKSAYYQKYESRGFSDDFKSLFNVMCCYDPALRPSVADILLHPCLQNDVGNVPVGRTTTIRRCE